MIGCRSLYLVVGERDLGWCSVTSRGVWVLGLGLSRRGFGTMVVEFEDGGGGGGNGEGEKRKEG